MVVDGFQCTSDSACTGDAWMIGRLAVTPSRPPSTYNRRWRKAASGNQVDSYSPLILFPSVHSFNSCRGSVITSFIDAVTDKRSPGPAIIAQQHPERSRYAIPHPAVGRNF